MMLLPKAVLADGDLADMVRNVGEGAKTAQSSSITIAQFIGVILFLGGLIGLKKVGKRLYSSSVNNINASSSKVNEE